MTNDNEWGFYGRKREINSFMKYLSTTGVNATAVIGGRGTGKTELIKKVFKQFIETHPKKNELSALNLQLEILHIIYKHGKEVYERQTAGLCDYLQAQEQNIASLLPEYDNSSIDHKLRFFHLSVEKILARGSSPGVFRWTQIIQAFQKRGKTSKQADYAAYVLEDHLGIVRFTPNPFPEHSKYQAKIRLIEPAAKFELMIKKEFDAWAKKDRILKIIPEKIINLMKALEGFGLERLTAEWLKNFNGIKYVSQSLVWAMPPDQTGGKKNAELDVVGDGNRFGDPSHRPLVICSRKRNDSAHQVHNTHVEIEDYIRCLSEDEKQHRPANTIQRVLISPQWAAGTNKEPQKDGFYRFDLQDMEAATHQENAPFPILETAPKPDPRPDYSDDRSRF